MKIRNMVFGKERRNGVMEETKKQVAGVKIYTGDIWTLKNDSGCSY